jgi:hypothetical protein
MRGYSPSIRARRASSRPLPWDLVSGEVDCQLGTQELAGPGAHHGHGVFLLGPGWARATVRSEDDCESEKDDQSGSGKRTSTQKEGNRCDHLVTANTKTDPARSASPLAPRDHGHAPMRTPRRPTRPPHVVPATPSRFDASEWPSPSIIGGRQLARRQSTPAVKSHSQATQDSRTVRSTRRGSGSRCRRSRRGGRGTPR